ncbi:MAG TPA: hypothetical protein VLG38_04200, partial [Gammaproteobacteria bacterium]|nr:hypothetical protein [Gammaproteobacteria bacterium]
MSTLTSWMPFGSAQKTPSAIGEDVFSEQQAYDDAIDAIRQTQQLIKVIRDTATKRALHAKLEQIYKNLQVAVKSPMDIAIEEITAAEDAADAIA